MNKIIDKYHILNNKKIKDLLSLLVTLIMLVYNEIVGLYLNSIWNMTIAIYFFFLLINRIVLYKANNENKKLKIIVSISLLIESLFLIGPIIIMLIDKKVINFSTIFAITMATYTTYIIVIAIINFINNKKTKDKSLKYTINLIDAIVSILNLQYALIHVFSDNIQEMKALMVISSILFYILILIIVIKQLKETMKKPI